MHRKLRIALASALAVWGMWSMATAPDVVAQGIWALDSANFTGQCVAYADDPDDSDPPCTVTDAQVGTVAGMYGKDLGGGSQAWCKLTIFYGPLLGGGHARFWLDGLGTTVLTIECDVYAKTAHKADRSRYHTYGQAILQALAGLSVANLPGGTPGNHQLWMVCCLSNIRSTREFK